MAKVFRSGDSLVVVIPKPVAERYHLAPGVQVELDANDEGILLKPIGVPPWFSTEWERALDTVVDWYGPVLELLREE